MRRAAWGAAALLWFTGCAHALHDLAPLALAGGTGKDPAALLAEAQALFARRPDAAAVAQAEARFLAAAEADPRATEGLYGAVVADAWLIEHEKDAKLRGPLAAKAVQAGQWCDRRAPGSPLCDYALAIALGVQARENPSTAFDAMKLIVERLQRAALADPKLDRAGPSRVLALLLVRAPGWPTGPGDAEAAVVEAKKAVGYFPDYPLNQLTLAEALLASGSPDEGRAAAQHALKLAKDRAAADDPDAADWIRDAEKLLVPADSP